MKKSRLMTLCLILSAAWLWTGCSTEDAVVDLDGPDNDSGVPITVEQVTVADGETRATNMLGNFSTFTMYGFNVTDTKTSLRLKGIEYTLDETTDPETNETVRSWKSSKPVTWPTKGTMEFYALVPTMSEPLITDLVMKAGQDKTLHHAIPAECTEQVDLLYAVQRNQTVASHDGGISLTFSHALSTLTLSSKNILGDPYTVTLYGLTIYNLLNEGTLLFSGNSASWTEDKDKYVDYTLTFAEPHTLSKTQYDNLTETEFFVGMPQAKATPYSTTGEEGTATKIADAKTARQVILGVKCKIKYDDTWILGDDDTVGEVYFSYTPAGKKWRNGMTYAMKFDFNGGYNEDGMLFLDGLEVKGMTIKIEKNWTWGGKGTDSAPITVEEWETDGGTSTELQF